MLQGLRDAGMCIAIDDFGTGYSSLSYLHRLPFDVLEIDRSFVKQLGVEADAQSVTRAIVALARALMKRVVAEGVETQRQAQQLRDIGCDELQGDLFARPMDAQALAAWLSARQAAQVLEPASTASALAPRLRAWPRLRSCPSSKDAARTHRRYCRQRRIAAWRSDP